MRAGLIDHAVEHLGEPPGGLTGITREFGHFGEAQLRIGEWQSAFGLFGGGHQDIRLVLVLDLDSTALEEFQLAVEGAKSDAQMFQDQVARSRFSREKANESM